MVVIKSLLVVLLQISPKTDFVDKISDGVMGRCSTLLEMMVIKVLIILQYLKVFLVLFLNRFDCPYQTQFLNHQLWK